MGIVMEVPDFVIEVQDRAKLVVGSRRVRE